MTIDKALEGKMPEIRLLRETENHRFYGVFIKNYAADQLDFLVYETVDYYSAVNCKDKLEQLNIKNRADYNKSHFKNNFIKAGCSV